MAAAKDDISLLEYLDASQINCLNEETGHDLKSILVSKKLNTSSSYLESSADAQLLLSIHFNQAVGVRTLILHSKAPSRGPKVLKILVNKPAISFTDVEDADDKTFAQIIELSEDDVEHGKPIALRFVRFKNVTGLHIFVESNQSGEDDVQTRIDGVDVLGVTVEATKNLSGLRQEDD
ncbi:hypothetical protein PAXRUDRAFT_821438 [Paxillus rubicundulus Ve08.2h10]|uniref:PITH domain-containing protein n=1 Tax=Paxillus rubicundulus Ve08.2h10 TaxID=930991 RepID=A0A0D0ED78_9AGAM|nr:hypothetical protein PAXRUDRAFT_821438 [Paxillus rubicundulus Ve08.2h10]